MIVHTHIGIDVASGHCAQVIGYHITAIVSGLQNKVDNLAVAVSDVWIVVILHAKHIVGTHRQHMVYVRRLSVDFKHRRLVVDRHRPQCLIHHQSRQFKLNSIQQRQAIRRLLQFSG